MIDFKQFKEVLENDFFYEYVIISLVIDEEFNFKGVPLEEFQCEKINNTLVITNCGNEEMLIPLDRIVKIEHDEIDNCFCLTMKNEHRILITAV